ncbi:MAG: acetyl-CoA hydrolase [Burkholderiales bacterium]|nr:acetyl-CoA hydrolase [Burkholderiales bacterium]
MRAPILADLLRPGDRVVIGQATAEPEGLVADLFALAPRLGALEVFCGLSFNPAWAGEVPPALRVSGYCGLGTLRGLVASGRAHVMPCSLSQLSALLAARRLPVDAVLLQVAPADADGYHSLGAAVDYTWDATRVARRVIVEVNACVPRTRCGLKLHRDEVVVARTGATPLREAPQETPTAAQHQVAREVARLVPDGATIQLGIGSLAAAVAHALSDRRGLRVRAGTVGDWLVDLVERGAIDAGDPDACLASLACGGRRLYGALSRDGVLGFAHPSQLVQPVPGSPFMAINSAIEVDLHGQVNAEYLGGRLVGAVGGQTDYFRAARQSAGGLAILALPSTSGPAAASRIVARLAGPCVTSAQSDVDVIVTEHGAADIRATTLKERSVLITDIAHPDARAALRAAAMP